MSRYRGWVAIILMAVAGGILAMHTAGATPDVAADHHPAQTAVPLQPMAQSLQPMAVPGCSDGCPHGSDHHAGHLGAMCAMALVVTAGVALAVRNHRSRSTTPVPEIEPAKTLPRLLDRFPARPPDVFSLSVIRC